MFSINRRDRAKNSPLRAISQDRHLATTVYLATDTGENPCTWKGKPGVGKTEVAKVLAKKPGYRPDPAAVFTKGLDTNLALYEWNYLRQMLEVRLQEAPRCGQERNRRQYLR